MPADPYRLIVVANRTCPCPGLVEEVAGRVSARDGEVLVVAPALNSRLRHWLSDSDAAVAAAHARLGMAVTALRDAGVRAAGTVGDADPLLAVEDAMAGFRASELILSTWPAGVSNWLERDLVARAKARFMVPVLHLESPYDAPVAVQAA